MLDSAVASHALLLPQSPHSLRFFDGQASARTIAHLEPSQAAASFFRLAEPYVQQLQAVCTTLWRFSCAPCDFALYLLQRRPAVCYLLCTTLLCHK